VSLLAAISTSRPVVLKVRTRAAGGVESLLSRISLPRQTAGSVLLALYVRISHIH